MASSVKSSLLRRTSTLRRSNINPLRNITNDGSYKSNEYILSNFFEGENYLSIIKCLDGGHEVAMDLIDYMQNYYDLIKEFINSLTSYSNKWKSKLKHQPSISSYNTTKRAQYEAIGFSEKLAQLLQTRCDAIQQVISTYKKQVNKMFVSERLGTVYKHCQSEATRKSFKNARSSLVKISEELDKLHEKEKRADSELHDAKVQCQNLELDETKSESKRATARDHREDKERKLELIRERISRAEEEQNREREVYHGKATEIYLQCRDLEKERLDQIRQTLTAFGQAMHSTEFSKEQDAMYANLLLSIKNEQDTLADLAFWEKTYQVNILTLSETNESQKPTKSDKKETNNLTTIDENQSVTEPEQASADTTTTKAKPKKKKTNSSEPTTPDVSQVN